MNLDYRHDGRNCPIGGDENVIVQFRNGKVSKQAIAASKWRWKRWPEGNHDFDIVSYSIIENPKDAGGTWTAVSGGYA
jgi:hypothetical protein